VTAYPSYPDGEPLCAALGASEAVRDLDPGLRLADAAAALLEAAAGRRDVAVRARDLDLAGGVLFLGGERLRLRPYAARQLHDRVAQALEHRVHRGDDARRGLALLGDRVLVLRVELDEVRAVLGGRFRALDDAEVITRIARAANAMGWSRDLLVRFLATSESRTVVRATLGRSRADVRPGDSFERGVEIANSEVGGGALRFTSITWRTRCFNFTRAMRPALRLLHVGPTHRIERDLRKDIAHVLHGARQLLDGWRTSAAFEEANAVSSAAKGRGLAVRLAEESRAQQVAEDAAVLGPGYAAGIPRVNAS
jgi:hypothetical protein